MRRMRLIRAAAGLLTFAAVPWGWAPAPRASAFAVRVEASATAVVLDVADERLRVRALATATSLVAAQSSSARAVAVVDVADGLAVAEDFTTDRERALDGVQRLGAHATWTYRHLTAGMGAVDALREVVTDTARQGAPAHVVLLAELSEARATTRDYSALRDDAAALGVALHVITYRPDDGLEGSLLGATITSTAQAMQDCDPSRVACGAVEQVGQEARTARATALGTMQRALSRLARDTGGRLTDRPDDIDALMRQLAMPRPARRPRPVTSSDRAETWRTRETNALAQRDPATAVTGHIDGLHTIRVPTDAGTRLVLAMAPWSAHPGAAGPLIHVLRVRDAAGVVRAMFSAAQANGSATDAMLHAVDLPPGPHMVEALVDDEDGVRIERRVADIEPVEVSHAGDLFLAARAEEIGSAAAHPLSDRSRRFVPRASSVLRRSTSADLVAVLPLRQPVGVSLVVELMSSEGRPRRSVVDVPARGAGEVTFAVIRFPIADLADGTHTLRVSAEQGGRAWQRTRTFRVEP